MISQYSTREPVAENLTFRLTETDKRRVFKTAETNGLTVGQFIRRAIADAMRQEGAAQ